MKNKIDKNEIIEKFKQMTAREIEVINDSKLMTYYLLIKIMEIFNIYNKSLIYSVKLLEEYPYIYKNKDEYLCLIDNKFMNINNDEINIYHHNLIKNTYSTNNKHADIINLKRGKDKNFEMSFK